MSAVLLAAPLCVLQGRTVSFKNTLVLLTSNIGSRVIAATSSGLPVFGSSRRQLMGDDEEADAAVLAAERVSGLL
jgi:ATP-dependent Clp protease ATP-binding subunit ClpA